jgi:hypothetical protein
MIVQTKKVAFQNHLLKRIFSRPLFDENKGHRFLFILERSTG